MSSQASQTPTETAQIPSAAKCPIPQAPVNEVVLTPAFILGVTGNNDPAGYVHWPPTFSLDGTHFGSSPEPAIQAIIDAVTATLDWLIHTSPRYLPSGRLDPLAKRFFDFESPPPDSPQAYQSCWRPLGLGETPIVVLSSLAPGIDTLVVETVFAYLSAHPNARITVRAPLPFPEDIYAEASSFTDSEPRRNPHSIPEAPIRRLEHVLGLIKSQAGFCAERDIFEVPLHEQVRCDPALNQQGSAKIDLKAGDPNTGKKRRNLRYRAAGEYVAAYSDILLACYDEIHDQLKPFSLLDLNSPGTATIVEAKRSGLTDGLLPIPNIIAWADTGPVLHLPIDRLKHLDNKKSNTPSADKRSMRLLQPYDNRPGAEHVCPRHPDLSPRWQENGHRILTAAVKNLAAYCKLLPTAPSESGSRENSLRNLFSVKDAVSPPRTSIEASVATALSCASFPFGAYAAIRDATSKVNGAWGTKADTLHLTMFRISIASVLLFVLSTTNVSEVMSMGEAASGLIRKIAFTIASALFFLALLLHKGYSPLVILGLATDEDDPPPSEIEDRQFDYRAIAEGMRVQAYWSVSGLFTSVASRYIQRLRGELGWIRCVISSATFPYKRTCDWFAGLKSPLQRIEILEAVQHGWIQGQIDYFTNTIKKDSLLQESWGAIGRALLAGSFVLAAYSLYASVCGEVPLHGLVPLSTLFTLLALSMLVAPFGIWFAEHLTRIGPGFKDPDEKIRKKTWWHFWKIFFPTLWQEAWTCTQAKAETRVRHLHLGCALIFGTSSALLFAFSPILLAGDSATQCTADVTGGLKSALLGLSGLVIVWMERRFLAENIRRYSAMLGLFTGANARLNNKLVALRALIPATADATQPTPPPTPGTADEERKLILECQDLLLALGQEALTENAEWIVMRRNRRIEPVPPSL